MRDVKLSIQQQERKVSETQNIKILTPYSQQETKKKEK